MCASRRVMLASTPNKWVEAMETVQDSEQPVAHPQEAPHELRFRNSAADWAIRTIIFVVFLFFASGKFKNDADAPWILLFNQIGLGDWFRYLTGVLEIAGAFLVLISSAVEIGLALLAAIMLGALVVVLLVLHKFSEAYFPFAFLCGLIAFSLHRRRV